MPIHLMVQKPVVLSPNARVSLVASQRCRMAGAAYTVENLQVARLSLASGQKKRSSNENRSMLFCVKQRLFLAHLILDVCSWLPRPKGMHQRTYEKLLRKVQHGSDIFCAEAKRLFNLCGEDFF